MNSGIDHETDDQITSAANWLADNWHVAPQPFTRTLRASFGLSFNDAVKAMAEAKRINEGRAMGSRAQNPMRRSWLDDTDGGWIAHRLTLLVSPSWRYRPKPLCRIIERLEIEHMRHAGKENRRLCVSYDQFVKAGVSRRAIRPALDAGQNLGLIAIVQPEEWSGNVKSPNEYRLTYVPEKDRRAPTDEWSCLGETKAKQIASNFTNVYAGKTKARPPNLQASSTHSYQSLVP